MRELEHVPVPASYDVLALYTLLCDIMRSGDVRAYYTIRDAVREVWGRAPTPVSGDETRR